MQVCDWLKSGIFRLREREFVCVMACVHRRLFLGTAGLWLRMLLGGSGLSRGTGHVSASPERRGECEQAEPGLPACHIPGPGPARPSLWWGQG